MRCTQATLEALGVYGRCPQYGTGVLEALIGAGLRTRIHDVPQGGLGLRTVIQARPHGRWYLCSQGHAMALVDGVLIDTSERRVSDRIKVWAIVEILD